MFRYRYDTEAGLFYLQSRYYNPEWGRFINADGIIGQTGELLGHNLFAYCKNNPVNSKDPDGFRMIASNACWEDFEVVVKVLAPVIVFCYTAWQVINMSIKNTAESVTNSIRNTTKSATNSIKNKVNKKIKMKSKKKTKNYDADKEALDSLDKELEDKYRRNCERITDEETRIVDEWCKEIDVPQHYGTDKGKDTNSWNYGNHTDVRGRHILFK